MKVWVVSYRNPSTKREFIINVWSSKEGAKQFVAHSRARAGNEGWYVVMEHDVRDYKLPRRIISRFSAWCNCEGIMKVGLDFSYMGGGQATLLTYRLNQRTGHAAFRMR